MPKKQLRDKRGAYIPICRYGWHPGVSKNPELCEERRCVYYHKVYFNRRFDERPDCNKAGLLEYMI